MEDNSRCTVVTICTAPSEEDAICLGAPQHPIGKANLELSVSRVLYLLIRAHGKHGYIFVYGVKNRTYVVRMRKSERWAWKGCQYNVL